MIELLIVVSIIGIVAGIAVPSLLSARAAANETSAIGSLRAVWSGQATYSTVCGWGGYATSLPVLAVSPGGIGAPFLSPDLTAGATISKGGFNVTLNNGGSPAFFPDCNGTPTTAEYYASATPIDVGVTGSRSFAVDQVGVIYFAPGASAPNPASAGTPIQ